MFSLMHDIVKSTAWANMIVEDGLGISGMLGLTHTEETRAKMSGPRAPMTEETKVKLRKPKVSYKKRAPYTEEERAKRSWSRGPRPPEVIEKMRKPRGPMSEEHKAKLRGPRGPNKRTLNNNVI